MTSQTSKDNIKNLLLSSNMKKRKKLKHIPKLQKYCKIAAIVVIVVPLVFKYSIQLQRQMIFAPYYSQPQEFINVSKYLNGTRNIYVTVNLAENITLGVWHILPQGLIGASVRNKKFNYSRSLNRPNYPVLLHFHGNGGNRIFNIKAYLKLRKAFHIIAFDYRSYGDSSKADLTEEGMVQDSVMLYKWLFLQTASHNIYLWGHSLGAALATHTAARLQQDNIRPMGLILESPFTTLREEVQQLTLAKVFSWLPWFQITILDGLEDNGFCFDSSANILKVDCPIMILHAEDDFLIPYTLGKKLAQASQQKRNPTTQGNVTFHLFPAWFQYNHFRITQAPEMLNYIRQYVKICEAYNRSKSIEMYGRT